MFPVDLFNQLPVPVLVTDAAGNMLDGNAALLAITGGSRGDLPRQPMDSLLPPAGRIFLQTHIWPTLMREGSVNEAYLQLRDAAGLNVPVMVNCRKAQFDGADAFYWILFVARERSRFEAAVLSARDRAETYARSLAESERFTKTVTDAMPGLVAYWDRDLCCRFANRAYLAWFGKQPEEMIGIHMRDFLGDTLFTENRPYVEAALTGASQHFERTLQKPDGSIGHLLAHYIAHTDDRGATIGLFVLAGDVTVLKHAERDMQLAASVFNSTMDGIMVADSDGKIISVNPAFTDITGYSAGEAIGRTAAILGPDQHNRDVDSAMAQELATNHRWTGESWARRKDGSAFRQWQSITTIDSAIDGSAHRVHVFNDVTERWQDDERNRYLAYHDPLTDLPNRALMTERLGQLLILTKREKRSVAVMLLDLDRFKAVNDTHGHAVGDALLKEVAARLRGLVRETDTVARLGGDEFVILLDNPASDEEVARIAARIVASLGEPMLCGGKLVQIGTSIGIARYPIEGETPSDLIRNADAAMYTAKAGGKNTFRFSSANTIRLPIDAPSTPGGALIARMVREPLEARARSA